MKDDELIPLILEDREVACPGCGYGLSGVRAPACPECGEALRLHPNPIVLVRKPDADIAPKGGGGYLALQLGLAIPMTVLSITMLISLSELKYGTFEPWTFLIQLVGFGVHLAAFLLLQKHRNRVAESSVWAWLGLLALCWWWLLLPIGWGILENLI